MGLQPGDVNLASQADVEWWLLVAAAVAAAGVAEARNRSKRQRSTPDAGGAQ